MARLSCLLVMVIAASSGCSICCTPWDYAYPAYGGKWERTDRFHGRVGSAFEPAGPFPPDQDDAMKEPTSSALPPIPTEMKSKMPDEDLPPPEMMPETEMPETEPGADVSLE